MSTTIRPMTDKDLEQLKVQVAIEDQQENEAIRQSYDRALMLTELSEYDLDNMDRIIRDDYGNWFQARLLRALHLLLPYADGPNLLKLRTAYPGTCAAYMAWYQGRIPKA